MSHGEASRRVGGTNEHSPRGRGQARADPASVMTEHAGIVPREGMQVTLRDAVQR
jgi:hypothetical protein